MTLKKSLIQQLTKTYISLYPLLHNTRAVVVTIITVMIIVVLAVDFGIKFDSLTFRNLRGSYRNGRSWWQRGGLVYRANAAGISISLVKNRMTNCPFLTLVYLETNRVHFTSEFDRPEGRSPQKNVYFYVHLRKLAT